VSEQQTDEKFLSRWSRLKRETADVPAPAPAAEDKPAALEEQPLQLPPVESLTKDSDYSVFFQPKVDESLRRAALKKLFTDPHFNVIDGLDTYIDDYSITEPVTAEMLAGMRSAQKIFQWARGETDEEAAKKEAEAKELAAKEQGALLQQTEDVTASAASIVEPQSTIATPTEEANLSAPSFRRRPESST
jgi:hypothetical protein